MLGLGRALGETMAVATVLSSSPQLTAHILDPAGGTFAQNIAARFNEATDFGRDALVNGAARLIIARRKEYAGGAA
jgi:phosphate transport system permease protein